MDKHVVVDLVGLLLIKGQLGLFMGESVGCWFEAELRKISVS